MMHTAKRQMENPTNYSSRGYSRVICARVTYDDPAVPRADIQEAAAPPTQGRHHVTHLQVQVQVQAQVQVGPNKKESESDRAAERFWPNPAVPKCDLDLTQLCRRRSAPHAASRCAPPPPCFKETIPHASRGATGNLRTLPATGLRPQGAQISPTQRRLV